MPKEFNSFQYWEFDDYLDSYLEKEANDFQPSFADSPTLATMESLFSAYCFAKQKKIPEKKAKIAEVQRLFDQLSVESSVDEQVSLRAIRNIVWSTIYSIEYLLGDIDSAEKAYAEINDYYLQDGNLSDDVVATCFGCQAIVWSKLRGDAFIKAMGNAREACNFMPSCALWQLILYRSTRNARMFGHFDEAQINELWDFEKKVLDNCLKLTNKTFFKLHKAQVYFDCLQVDKARHILDLIYPLNASNSIEVVMKLVESYARCCNLEKANLCLIELRNKGFQDCLLENSKKELDRLKKIVSRSFIRDMNDAYRMIKFDKNSVAHFDIFEKMLIKYGDTRYRQIVLLNLGMLYRNKNQFANACQIFVLAIELDPNSAILKGFRNRFGKNKKLWNVFEYIANFLIVCRKEVNRVEPELVKKLAEYCQNAGFP